jgi:hypothetical protein
MSRKAFVNAMKTMPSFRNLMYAYVQAFMEQVLVSVRRETPSPPDSFWAVVVSAYSSTTVKQ